MSHNLGSSGEFLHAYARNQHSNFHFWRSLVCVMNTLHKLDRLAVCFLEDVNVLLPHPSVLHNLVAFLVVLTCLPVLVSAFSVLPLPANQHQALAALLALRFLLLCLCHYLLISSSQSLSLFLSLKCKFITVFRLSKNNSKMDTRFIDGNSSKNYKLRINKSRYNNYKLRNL